MEDSNARIGIVFDDDMSDQLYILSEVYEKSPYDLLTMALDIMFQAYLGEEGLPEYEG